MRKEHHWQREQSVNEERLGSSKKIKFSDLVKAMLRSFWNLVEELQGVRESQWGFMHCAKDMLQIRL